jgi:hypothetical protein
VLERACASWRACTARPPVALASGVSAAALRRSETAWAEVRKGKWPELRGADERGSQRMSWGSILEGVEGISYWRERPSPPTSLAWA